MIDNNNDNDNIKKCDNKNYSDNYDNTITIIMME